MKVPKSIKRQRKDRAGHVSERDSTIDSEKDSPDFWSFDAKLAE